MKKLSAAQAKALQRTLENSSGLIVAGKGGKCSEATAQALVRCGYLKHQNAHRYLRTPAGLKWLAEYERQQAPAEAAQTTSQEVLPPTFPPDWDSSKPIPVAQDLEAPDALKTGEQLPGDLFDWICGQCGVTYQAPMAPERLLPAAGYHTCAPQPEAPAEPGGFMRPCDRCNGTGVVEHENFTGLDMTCPDCDGTGIYTEHAAPQPPAEPTPGDAQAALYDLSAQMVHDAETPKVYRGRATVNREHFQKVGDDMVELSTSLMKQRDEAWQENADLRRQLDEKEAAIRELEIERDGPFPGTAEFADEHGDSNYARYSRASKETRQFFKCSRRLKVQIIMEQPLFVIA